jgi:hypothetical protein
LKKSRNGDYDNIEISKQMVVKRQKKKSWHCELVEGISWQTNGSKGTKKGNKRDSCLTSPSSLS